MGESFVLSVEGMEYRDRITWSTHKVLGTFRSYDEAAAAAKEEGIEDLEKVFMITNTETGLAFRIIDEERKV